MPGGDKSGPAGMGPRTGRAMGYCSGYRSPGFANPGFGRGRGMGMRFGRGHGRGFRHRYYTTGVPGWAAGPYWQDAPAPEYLTKEQELQELKNEADHLQSTLKNIESRIKDLESKSENE